MLFGIPADVWDTLIGIGTLLVSVLTVVTVIIGATITVRTYRNDVARRERALAASRETDTRALEVWIENRYINVVSTIAVGESKRGVTPEDRAPDGWENRTVASRPDDAWFLELYPAGPDRERILQQLERAPAAHRSFFLQEWAPSIEVRNHGENPLRVARVEYDWVTYVDTTGAGAEIWSWESGFTIPFSAEYESSRSPQFWSPQQEDGAVQQFPWMVDSADQSAVRVPPGEQLSLVSLREKANALAGISLLDSLDGENTPVAIALALRAWWTIDRTGTYWEHRDGQLRELGGDPDWARRPRSSSTP